MMVGVISVTSVMASETTAVVIEAITLALAEVNQICSRACCGNCCNRMPTVVPKTLVSRFCNICKHFMEGGGHINADRREPYCISSSPMPPSEKNANRCNQHSDTCEY